MSHNLSTGSGADGEDDLWWPGWLEGRCQGQENQPAASASASANSANSQSAPGSAPSTGTGAQTANVAVEGDDADEPSAPDAATEADAPAKTSNSEGSGPRGRAALPEIELGIELSDGYLTTPVLTPSELESRPDSRAADPRTPYDELSADALVAYALDHGEDDAAAEAVLNLIMLANDEAEARTDAPQDQEPLLAADDEDGAMVGALLRDALQGDEAASAILFALVKDAGPLPDVAGRETSHDAAAARKEDVEAARLDRVQTETTPQTAGPAPSQRKRARSLIDNDEGKQQVPAPRKRGKAAAGNAGRTGRPRNRSETAAKARPAWRGPSPSRASSSASARAEPTGSTTPLPSAAPMSEVKEESGASRVIRLYCEQQQRYIDQSANAILALSPNAPCSQLGPRRYRMPAERASIRRIGQTSSFKRRASLADPRFEECKKCFHEYGLKDEPIWKGRLEQHETEYHNQRMCSVCGVPLNGRDTERCRKHRQDCSLWRAMVVRGFHTAWIRGRGFYGDEESEREFWDTHQLARVNKQAGGNEQLRIQLLEMELERREVRALRELIPGAQTQPPATRHSTAPQGTKTTAAASASAAPYQWYYPTMYPQQAQHPQVVHRPSDAQPYLQEQQFWLANAAMGQWNQIPGPSAASSMTWPVPSYPSQATLAPSPYYGQPQATYAPGFNAHGYAFRRDQFQYRDGSRGAASVVAQAGTVGAQSQTADQGRRDSNSANAFVVADNADNALPAAPGPSQSVQNSDSGEVDNVEYAHGTYDDDEDDLYD